MSAPVPGRLEVDAHEDPPGRRAADLGEACSREDAPAADVKLSPRDLPGGLHQHWVALERAGAVLTGEIDGGAGLTAQSKRRSTCSSEPASIKRPSRLRRSPRS